MNKKKVIKTLKIGLPILSLMSIGGASATILSSCTNSDSSSNVIYLQNSIVNNINDAIISSKYNPDTNFNPNTNYALTSKIANIINTTDFDLSVDKDSMYLYIKLTNNEIFSGNVKGTKITDKSTKLRISVNQWYTETENSKSILISKVKSNLTKLQKYITNNNIPRADVFLQQKYKRMLVINLFGNEYNPVDFRVSSSYENQQFQLTINSLNNITFKNNSSSSTDVVYNNPSSITISGLNFVQQTFNANITDLTTKFNQIIVNNNFTYNQIQNNSQAFNSQYVSNFIELIPTSFSDNNDLSSIVSMSASVQNNPTIDWTTFNVSGNITLTLNESSNACFVTSNNPNSNTIDVPVQWVVDPKIVSVTNSSIQTIINSYIQTNKISNPKVLIENFSTQILNLINNNNKVDDDLTIDQVSISANGNNLSVSINNSINAKFTMPNQLNGIRISNNYKTLNINVNWYMQPDNVDITNVLNNLNTQLQQMQIINYKDLTNNNLNQICNNVFGNQLNSSTVSANFTSKDSVTFSIKNSNKMFMITNENNDIILSNTYTISSGINWYQLNYSITNDILDTLNTLILNNKITYTNWQNYSKTIISTLFSNRLTANDISLSVEQVSNSNSNSNANAAFKFNVTDDTSLSFVDGYADTGNDTDNDTGNDADADTGNTTYSSSPLNSNISINQNGKELVINTNLQSYTLYVDLNSFIDNMQTAIQQCGFNRNTEYNSVENKRALYTKLYELKSSTNSHTLSEQQSYEVNLLVDGTHVYINNANQLVISVNNNYDIILSYIYGGNEYGYKTFNFNINWDQISNTN